MKLGNIPFSFLPPPKVPSTAPALIFEHGIYFYSEDDFLSPLMEEKYLFSEQFRDREGYVFQANLPFPVLPPRFKSVALPRASSSQHEKMAYYNQIDGMLKNPDPLIIWVPTTVEDYYFRGGKFSPSCNPYTFQGIQFLLQHLPPTHAAVVGYSTVEYSHLILQPPTHALPL